VVYCPDTSAVGRAISTTNIELIPHFPLVERAAAPARLQARRNEGVVVTKAAGRRAGLR
jgi:hypothetical protein